MTRLRIDITGASEARRVLLQIGQRVKGSKKPAMDNIAQRLMARILRNIDAGNVAPLSEATLRMRQTRRRNPTSSTKPLVDTGKMRSRVRAISDENVAQALADTFYAGFVQLGIQRTSGAIPGKRIPPRPFMLLETEDIDWATQHLLDFMLSADERAAA